MKLRPKFAEMGDSNGKKMHKGSKLDRKPNDDDLVPYLGRGLQGSYQGFVIESL